MLSARKVRATIPIINANMHAVCSEKLINGLISRGALGSYHRFFEDIEERNRTISKLLQTVDTEQFFPSIGVQKEDYDFVGWLIEKGAKNIIIDVNHGHHKKVGNILDYIRRQFKANIIIMAGNVASTDGIKYLVDHGADIVKIGNSYGSVCTTRFATAIGVHCLHVAKTYREETGNWDTMLCLDGSISTVADIAKCMIWGNLVMVGKMLASCEESCGRVVVVNDQRFKSYYGNASIFTKQIAASENGHLRYIEGTSKLIPATGPLENTLNTIVDGLQGSYSMLGAKNLDEFQRIAPKQVLMVK